MNAGDPAALPLLPSGSMPDAAGRWGSVQAGGRGQPPPRSAFVKAPRGAGCCLLSRGCAPPPGSPVHRRVLEPCLQCHTVEFESPTPYLCLIIPEPHLAPLEALGVRWGRRIRS